MFGTTTDLFVRKVEMLDLASQRKGSVQARFTRTNPEAARASGLASAPPPPADSAPGPLAIVPQAPLVPRIDEAPATVASPIRSALVANPSGSFDIDLSFDDAREPSSASAKPVSTIVPNLRPRTLE